MTDRVQGYYRRVSMWAARHIAPLFAISFVLLFVAVALIRVEAHQRSAVDSARTAQLKWDKAQDDWSACIRQAKGREESRHTFYVAFDTIARFASPEDRGELRAFVGVEKAAIAKALPPLDCTKIAPAPKGERPTIP